MGERSAIVWTDATWNPWQGCHKVSLGCRECYMFREKRAYGQDPDVVVRSKPHTFNMPLRLKEPKRVFTCSWSDWWIEEADPWRSEAWAIVERTPHLTYQIVTKRIERAAGRLPWGDGTPWPNVWMIVSAENQKTADERIPKLLALNVAVRGVSYEPALTYIDFIDQDWTTRDYLRGTETLQRHIRPLPGKLDWVIMGVESGSARSLGRLPEGGVGRAGEDTYWRIARIVHAQCRAASVAFFQKQGPVRGRVSTEPWEWALEDRVQEFPR